MAKLVETDEKAKFRAQLEEDVGPVVFINQFLVKPEDFEKFLKAWQKDAEYFRASLDAFHPSSTKALVRVVYS